MPYLNFENRIERRKAIEEFRKEAAGKNIEGYLQYAQAMDELDQLMEKGCELDSFGLPKPMDKAAKDELLAAMQKTALAGEAYLENVKKAAEKDPQINLKKGVPGMVGKLQQMLSKDFQVVSEYDPAAEQTSLPELLEKSRSATIDVNSADMPAVGGSMSTRTPLRIKNSKGEVKRGFFTKKTEMDFLKKYKASIEKVKKLTNKEKELKALDDLLPKYKEHIIKLHPETKNRDDAYFADKLVRECCGEDNDLQTGSGFSRNHFKKVLEDIGLDPGLTFGGTVRSNLGAEFEILNRGAHHVNIHFLGLKEGERVDSANCGMSSVSTLLGKPDLLAKSVNMNIRDEKGNVTNGSFMDLSEGLNLNSNPDDFQAVSDMPLEGTEGKLIKDLADIQVIDYICGNLDRHFGNMTYKVNEKGKIIGIQGIDNDCSFPRDGELKKHWKEFGGLDHMNCISQSMADKIKSLDPAMLKFSLRGKGLSEEQIDFSVQRLLNLKDAIAKGEKHYENKPAIEPQKAVFDEGFLRTVPDKDFEKLSLVQTYCHVKKGKQYAVYNVFNEFHEWFAKGFRSARRSGRRYDPKYKTDEIRYGRAATSESRYSAEELADPLKNADRIVRRGNFNVDDLTVKNNGTQKFADIVSTAKELNEMRKELQGMKERGVVLPAEEYKKYYERMKEKIDLLETRADTYLQGKIRQRKAHSLRDLRGKNEYEQKRINYAKDASAYAQEFKEAMKLAVKPADEQSEIDKADAHRVREQADLDERRAAMEALKKLHQEKNMASPEQIKKAQLAEKAGNADERDEAVLNDYQNKLSVANAAAKKNNVPTV